MHERDILLAALEKTRPEERAAYLTQVCGTDAELRGRLESLLRAADVQDSFLEHPAAETELFSRETDGIRREIAEQEELSLDFLHPVDEPGALGRLGPYIITEVIGRGGMGVVLKARDTKLNRIVAIKVLAPELASNPTARKRFQREAHAAAAVVHQHIVTIHAVDEDRLPYLVMECIVGQSLKEKIDREGHLKLIEILRIGQQVASGLAAAHAHGLIHRDVKPANILLENGVERVRITDFGLARAVDDVGMTRTGEVAGTPQYMSPEQAQGLPMDGRGDLFSFGCVLYAMCTGRPPFRAESSPAVLHRICHDTPRPIQEINPEIPDWLLAIIDRLLQKNPAERFQSAKEVADLLGQYLAHAQQPAIVPFPGSAPVAKDRQPRRRARPWSLAVVMILAATALGFGLTEASGVTKVMPTVIRIVRGEGTLVIEVDDPTVQVSLDGEALSIRGAGLQELRLLPGEYRLHATKDGQPVKDEVVTISRDGRKVVTVKREGSGGSGSSSVAPAVEEAVEELTLLTKLQGHTNILHAVSFLPGGERLVSVDQSTIVRTWDLETFSVLSTLDLKGGYCSAADVSANGRFVAIITASAERSRTIRVWDLQNRTQICEVTQQNVDYLTSIRFSPDGTRVVTSGKPSTGVLWDVATGKEVQRFEAEERQTFAVAFSPNGRLLAMGTFGRVRLFDVESGDVLGDAHLSEPHAVISLAFAPGGGSLACGQTYGHSSVIDVNSRQLNAWLTNGKSRSHVVSMQFIDNARLLIARYHGELELWDVARKKIVATAASGSGTTKRFALSPNGRYALAAHGEEWDDKSRKSTPNGDYALRLWQLPQSVWPKQTTATSSAQELPSVSSEPGAFALLAAGIERKFDTLTEAVQAASDGDTIEIRGNGPFLTETVEVVRPLTVRAGEGYAPSLMLSQTAVEKNMPLIKTSTSLVLEGLELKGVEGAKRPALIGALGQAELHVTNCRLIFGGQSGLINSDFVVCNVRNSQFNTAGWSAINWQCPPGARGTVENCVSATGGLMNLNLRGPSAKDVLVEIRNNTTIEKCLSLGFDQAQSPLAPPIRLNFCANVTRCPSILPGRAILRMDQAYLEPPLSTQDAESLLGALVTLQEKDNVYDAGSRMLHHAIFSKQTGTTFFEASQGKDVADWNRFWKQSDTGSVEGDVLFEGGDLVQKARANLGQLSAADFRLREGSAGYRAGPDGKDLGADVDLVGPGPAYERCKATPEYQVWLKNTGQLRAGTPKAEPGAFVLLGGKGVAERKFDTLADAVQAASDSDTIEIRSNGPFVSDGVAVANPLVIRAGEGYSPSITLSQTSADQNIPLLSASASLVLEGLELRRVGGAAGRVEDRFPALLKAWPGETLRVTNCRLVIERYEATLIGANVVALTLRNCELSGSVAWFSALGGRCDIENCVYASGGFGFSPSDPDFRDVSIRVRDNTFVGDCINLTLWSKPNLPDKSGAIPPFRLDVSRNVMHPWVAPRNRGVLYFHQYQFEEPFSAAEAESLLPRLVRLNEKQNVYRRGLPLLVVAADWEHLRGNRGRDLADWDRLWGQKDTGSVEGAVRFQGGDLITRARSAPEGLTAQDFRLRPDSAGYRAGKDGKDLGADVDLVGPGPAYERWKKTPEYQEWLKETGQMKPKESGVGDQELENKQTKTDP